jgi:hypothetical protein
MRVQIVNQDGCLVAESNDRTLVCAVAQTIAVEGAAASLNRGETVQAERYRSLYDQFSEPTAR